MRELLFNYCKIKPSKAYLDFLKKELNGELHEFHLQFC